MVEEIKLVKLDIKPRKNKTNIPRIHPKPKIKNYFLKIEPKNIILEF